MDPIDYGACQRLSETARQAGAQVIRYTSVRDPRQGANLAVLGCDAFSAPNPAEQRTWRILPRATGVDAQQEFPRKIIAFDREAFANDPRIAGMVWDRR